MIRIDGADGGGQVLRTALSLAALSGRAVTVESVRGDRPEPGLKPQHRAAVELAAAACDADVEGGDLGSERVTFEPGSLEGGEVAVSIPTAGAITLLFEVALPLAAGIDEPLRVTATGGTDVKWAPPLDAYRYGKLELLARAGWWTDLALERRGFYPAGGGRATLTVAPASPAPLDLADRGSLRSVAIHSTASESLADADVAERQAEAAEGALAEANLPVGAVRATYDETGSPGSAIVLVARFAGGMGVFDALGERGKPAEAVAGDAVAAFETFRESAAQRSGDDAASTGDDTASTDDRAPTGAPIPAVDAHLADQLLVPLAIGGGEVVVPRVTDHLETNRRVLEAFEFDVEFRRLGEGGPVRLSSSGAELSRRPD